MPHTRSRILIVDDDNDDFLIISDYIKNIPGYNFKIDWCYNYKSALEHISRKDYDIYLVDYRLGAKTGIDLIEEASNNNNDAPIILLTGRGHKELDIAAIKAGATDYLVKPQLNSEILERSIRYSLERAESMRALRENEKKYRTIFQKSKDAVFITDKNLCFIDYNIATIELLGYSGEELKTMCLPELVINKSKKNLLEIFIREKIDASEVELELLTKNGDTRICLFSLIYLEASDEEARIQCILHNISNIRKAEKANLQIQKLAATGRLVRTLAHEVRNPLNNINMSVEQLLDEVDNEDDKTYLDIIQRNMLRIDKLITELVNSSRPSELSFSASSLQEILEDSLSMAVDRLTLLNMKLHKSFTDIPVIIKADKEKLKIAFVNFFINAIEAMQPEKGVLEIDLKHIGEYKTVTIKDNGYGISEENLARLFEPYFTTKRNGVGLGLASTLNILQQHNAKIDVHSEINKGTTFTISFT